MPVLPRRVVLGLILSAGAQTLIDNRAVDAQTPASPAPSSDRFRAEHQDHETVTHASVVADLVTGNHILAHEGVLDAFGHLSVRDPDNDGRFIMSHALAPELITADDLIVYDLDGHALENKRGRQEYSERYIHAEIYRARQDVGSVVHAHTPGVIPFADTGVPLKAMNHMTSFLYQGAPVFEIRTVGGDATNMQVSNPAFGRALAQTLGSRPVVLMRGHGMTVVGGEVREAVYRAIFTEIDAQMETTAIEIAGGRQITFLGEREGATNERDHSGEAYNRAWFMWKARVGQN